MHEYCFEAEDNHCEQAWPCCCCLAESHLVSATQGRSAFSEPWKLPGETDGRPKVIPIVRNRGPIRIICRGADELDLGQLARIAIRCGQTISIGNAVGATEGACTRVRPISRKVHVPRL